MQADPILFAVFLIFTGAAVLAALALFARQSLLIAYIALGGLAIGLGLGLLGGIGQLAIFYRPPAK